jgi:hypothetical protein
MKITLASLLVAVAVGLTVSAARPQNALADCPGWTNPPVSSCLPLDSGFTTNFLDDSQALFYCQGNVPCIRSQNVTLGEGGYGWGIWGIAASGTGVYGHANGNTPGGHDMGVRGDLSSESPTEGAAAVRGTNQGTNGNGYGVYGSHDGSGTGVYGNSVSGIGVLGISSGFGLYGFGTYGVYGQAPAGGFAGYFTGDVNVTGTLTKGAGAFRIDHPLDPAHKYLQHSFVESPDMMNVYNGNVTTDRKGFAVVKLPGYFQALNRGFRYQLTSLSGLQEVAVAKEIEHNRFTIQSQKPHSGVSWQVTGIRHDAYANAHRIPVVVQKPSAEQGRYLHPELYGKPSSLSVVQPPAQAVKLTRR